MSACAPTVIQSMDMGYFPAAWLAVNGITEHVEHARKNSLSDRRLQWAARVVDRHATRETLCGSQCNPANVTRILLGQHFDDDSLFFSGVQHRVNRGQMLIEPDIHDTASHRHNDARIR